MVGKATTMLRHIPDNNIAFAVRPVYDITEAKPIPRGARVRVEDFDGCADCEGLFVVSYRVGFILPRLTN